MHGVGGVGGGLLMVITLFCGFSTKNSPPNPQTKQNWTTNISLLQYSSTSSIAEDYILSAYCKLANKSRCWMLDYQPTANVTESFAADHCWLSACYKTHQRALLLMTIISICCRHCPLYLVSICCRHCPLYLLSICCRHSPLYLLSTTKMDYGKVQTSIYIIFFLHPTRTLEMVKKSITLE